MFQTLEYCRACGLERPPEELSNRGLCGFCGRLRHLEAIVQLQRREGWIWEKWKRNYIASLSGVVERLRRGADHD